MKPKIPPASRMIAVPMRLFDPVRVILRRPESIHTLEVNRETVAALPVILQPFQARWLLGVSEKTLRVLRDMHPEWLVDHRGDTAMYSKYVLCAYAKIPLGYDRANETKPNPHP